MLKTIVLLQIELKSFESSQLLVCQFSSKLEYWKNTLKYSKTRAQILKIARMVKKPKDDSLRAFEFSVNLS